MLSIHKELCPQVLLRDTLMVKDGQAADTCQYQVLSHFVRQRFSRNQEDSRRSQSRISCQLLLELYPTGVIQLTSPGPSCPKDGSDGRTRRSHLLDVLVRWRLLRDWHIWNWALTGANRLGCILLRRHVGFLMGKCVSGVKHSK